MSSNDHVAVINKYGASIAVAVRTGFDGRYPVIATYDKLGNVAKVQIVFIPD